MAKSVVQLFLGLFPSTASLSGINFAFPPKSTTWEGVPVAWVDTSKLVVTAARNDTATIGTKAAVEITPYRNVPLTLNIKMHHFYGNGWSIPSK